MKSIDIIIFCGQSNMQGQTERLSNTDIVENALEYRYLDDTDRGGTERNAPI